MTSSPARSGKLGIIAGGGGLPRALASRCESERRPFFMLRLKGFADPDLEGLPGAAVGLGELGRAIELLRNNRCEAVCFVGRVQRPDFARLKPDLRGLRRLPAAIAAASQGDDALLRFVLGEFEAEGFAVEGAEGAGAATLPKGPFGRLNVGPDHAGDIETALRTARRLGELDIGQAVVVCRGLVLGVEAQEGTDALLARCAALPPALLGTTTRRAGVLLKWPKPSQDRRVDLPTLGVRTIEGAAAANLAGVASEAGSALLLDPPSVRGAADRLGLFLVGLAESP